MLLTSIFTGASACGAPPERVRAASDGTAGVVPVPDVTTPSEAPFESVVAMALPKSYAANDVPVFRLC